MLPHVDADDGDVGWEERSDGRKSARGEGGTSDEEGHGEGKEGRGYGAGSGEKRRTEKRVLVGGGGDLEGLGGGVDSLRKRRK